MTLRFEIFWRETANWQEENRQVWSWKIHNCAEPVVASQHVCGYKYMHRAFRSIQRTL